MPLGLSPVERECIQTDIPIQEITTEGGKKYVLISLSSGERMERLSTLDISPNQAEAILNAEMDDILFDGIRGRIITSCQGVGECSVRVRHIQYSGSFCGGTLEKRE